MRPQIRQNHIKTGLRDVHDPFQRRGRNVLPLFRLQRAAQDFQFRLVALQQSREKVAVEPIQAVDRVADAKSRMQIEQQMSVSQRPGKIEQHRALLRVRAELHAQIHGNRRGAHAALRTHHNDQLVRCSSGRVTFLVETHQNFLQRCRASRAWQ